MKNLSYLLIIITILAGCSTAKKYYQRGQYDAAVRKSVVKIRKKPDDRKNIEILEKAYPKANDLDMERIKFLKSEGQPDIWDEVFERYSDMKERQTLVKTICPIKLPERTINFQFVDYDKEIIEAKKKAAEYFYVHGKKLLDNGDKASARQAYNEFLQVKSYYSTYEDVDDLIILAREKGMCHAIVKVQDNTIFKLPADFKENLITNDYSRINQQWVEYDFQQRQDIEYDYTVLVNLKIIDVSPEGIKEEHVTESKEIDDGFEYVLDGNGNVMKDSLGNDIKIPKKKTISCLVVKTFQHKACHMEGTLDFINNFTGKTLKTFPIAADNFFDHVYAVGNGDLNALSSETRKLIGIKPLPFPTDFDMIFMAGDIFKKVTFDALYNNRSYLN